MGEGKIVFSLKSLPRSDLRFEEFILAMSDLKSFDPITQIHICTIMQYFPPSKIQVHYYKIK